MKRRSFISGFVGAIAAAAVSARLIREEPKIEVVRKDGTKFDPKTYVGDFKWVEAFAAETREKWENRYRQEYIRMSGNPPDHKFS